MNIAFLDSWFQSSAEGSGTAVGIHGLEQALRQAGHKVTRLAPMRDSPRNQLLRRLQFNWELPQHLRGPEYDLVVGFDIDGFLHSPRRRLKPYVVSIKGVLAEEARRETGKDYWMLKGLSQLERFNARYADLVVTTSEYCRLAIASNYSVPLKKIRVVPEGIDLGRWNNLIANTPRQSDGHTILCVARQYRRKRVIDLLEALALVRDSIPDVRAIILGAGPEHEKIRRAVLALNLTEHVTMQGEIPNHDDVARMYMRADVFCLPSIQEGFGIVFLEAMACGLPIISTKVTAIPEVVPHGKAGILVPPRNTRALAKAMIRLLRNRAEREEFGQFGRAYVQQFDWPNVARQFLQLTQTAIVR